MIEVSRLTYTFPGRTEPALHDVSLQIESGEFVLLTGPSGAGKSTLLRALSGLVPHFSGGVVAGHVRVCGHDPVREGPRPLSQVVGFVFQDPEAQAVVEEVEAEIAFGLENAAVPPDEMRLRVEEVLNLLDLEPLRGRPLRTLSGGERQRTAIAAALALRPQVLALDEPTSQLDPQSAEDVLGALARLNEDLGLTIILAEHRLERVLRQPDRIIALANGRVLVDAPFGEALAALPDQPPLVRLAMARGWSPLPRTTKEARRFAARETKGVAHRPPAPRRTEGAPLLQVEDIHFGYNGAPVLRGVGLEVNRGEIVALLGRNGSGKTTLLRLVMGLLTARAGEIRVDGEKTTGKDAARISRQVAYLPQNPDDLLFAESVADELAITLRNHRRAPREDEIAAFLHRLGLESVSEAYPRDLAVGQRQRVALGAVTVTRPPLLLLDEPTRGLDYSAKRQLIQLWQEWRGEGMGLLLVTHDVELVAEVADRVLVLGDGEIITGGPPQQVLPASPLFAPQIARLFPEEGWLTVADALAGYSRAITE
jgi:energy-coupling factor transport system ATP-binding protein